MATSLLELRTDVRSMIQEPSARTCSDAEINRWLNQGIRNFTAATKWYEKPVGYAAVANQAVYALAEDVLDVEMIWWLNSGGGEYRVRPLDESEWAAQKYMRTNQLSTIPAFALLFPKDRYVELHPAPSAASQATTLNGGINSAVTTITVTSTTGFASSGYAIVGTELIRYFAVTSTQLLQCIRGYGDTTAAAHLNGDACTQASVRLNARAMPPFLVADGDTTKLPETYIESLINYAVAKCFRKRQEYDKANAAMALYLQARKEAGDERMADAMDGSGGIKDEQTSMGYWADM